MPERILANIMLDRFLAEDFVTLRETCAIAQPPDVADAFAYFEAPEVLSMLMALDEDARIEIYPHMTEELQAQVAELMPPAELARLFSELYSDDRADIYRDLSEEKQQEVMHLLAATEREDLRRLGSYPEGSCGSEMTSDYMSLPPNISTSQAIARIRAEAPDKETIYYCYVVDKSRRLVGMVTLRDLILAHPERLVGDIMNPDVMHVDVNEDQETATRLIRRYDLIAVPVTDPNKTLVGIITHDDALDIVEQEHTEDLEKFMAIAGEHEAGAYLRTSVLQHFRNRVGWILGLAALGLVSGYIVQSFEGLLVQFAVLATFMPMLADSGGNTGSQSATLVIRAMALGEVKPRHALTIISKEFLIAAPLGILLGLFAMGRVFAFYGADGPAGGASPLMVGATVAIALLCQVVTATLIGALLPLGAARLKLDPAVIASPALTTIVDISGLLIFFTTAKMMLA
jgi:magnesium transporter